MVSDTRIKEKDDYTRTCSNYLRNLPKKTFFVIDTVCFLSKNLFNVGLYNERQHYHNIKISLDGIRPDLFSQWMNTKKTYIPYSRGKDNPDKDYSNYYLSKSNENFNLLPADVSRQTLMSLDQAYQSYFELKKLKAQGGYDKPVHLPHYLEKNGRYKSTWTKSSMTIKGNMVTLGMSFELRKLYNFTGKELTFRIPLYIKKEDLVRVTLLPIRGGKCYKIEWRYKVKKIEKELNYEKYLGIDLGLVNFATLVDNAIGTPNIIDGKYLKSINWRFNKTNARLQSIKDKQGISGITKRQNELFKKRECKINEAFHRISNWIIEYCIKNKIGNIVLPNWNGIKQNINLGKKGNQNFVSIPYDKFRTMLSSMCEIHGIKYLDEKDEAYTSQVDALAFHDIKKQPYGIKRRIKRGLYKSETGMLINADVNGALNHIRNVAGDGPVKEIASMGCLMHPVRLHLSYENRNNRVALAHARG